MAKANDYEIEELFEQHDNSFRCDICCVMKKANDNGFMTKEEFDKLPIYVEPNANYNSFTHRSMITIVPYGHVLYKKINYNHMNIYEQQFK